jgi:hypothetical protein
MAVIRYSGLTINATNEFLDPKNLHIDTKIVIIGSSDAEIYLKLHYGGHLGRHLGFLREHKVDSWGLLICCSERFWAPILKKSACY